MKNFFCLFVLAASSLLAPQAFANEYCCDSCGDCFGTNFSGPYIGGNLGALRFNASRDIINGVQQQSTVHSTSCCSIIETNVILGLQLGYDWRCGCKIFGFVVDWNWMDTDRRFNDDDDDGIFFDGSFNWFTTIRGRAGLTICDTLIYLTGGAVITSFDTQFSDQTDSHDDDARLGLAAGVGAEFLLSCINVSLGVEFLYFQFSLRERCCSDNHNCFSSGNSDHAWVGRLTINYRFGDLFSGLGCCGY